MTGCADKKIELTSPALSVYYPLNVGKFIVYKVDSSVLTQFGRDTIVRRYQAKDVVDAKIIDATGRESFRIIRSMSNSTGTAPFVATHTFQASAQGTDWMEYVENNLRYMRLRFPIFDGFEWKGNSFIDASSINSQVRYLFDWTYRYENVGLPFTIEGKTYNNTITVLQRNEIVPEGPFNPQFFKQYDYSIEVFAEGIGLVYKNFDHKVWQPPTPAPDIRPGFWEDGSYRIVLKAIQNN